MIKHIGANYFGNGQCEFVLWGPLLDELSLHIVSGTERIIPLAKDKEGYWSVNLSYISPGTRYFYRLKRNIERPDPASHYQPEDIFGASCVIDHADFPWSDQSWQGVPLERMIIYELHVGTFTTKGTFEAIIPKLDYLCDLGITAIEIMPVAAFPGERNWGYDGVFPFAVQHSYGGPQGLKELIDHCHKQGIAVILDVVYNHLGPEGNVLFEFMPCFTDKYRTPWGKALNFDDAHSWGIRNFFIQNALFWLENYHIDTLRLDAIHGIYDISAKHFLKELAENVKQLSVKKGRNFYLIAESDLNDIRVITHLDWGGYGMDAQWNDDFHHALHALLTCETQGYYTDFGEIAHLVKALTEGFVYAWEYSYYRKRYHGSSTKDIPAWQLIICSQNHDQVGNRVHGERLSMLVSFEALKLAAAVVMLSPYIPLLFMGEECAQKTPFLYFMSFYDKKLIGAVRESRKKEFAALEGQKEPPDPYDRQTFMCSKLRWDIITQERHRAMFIFYQKLIRLRKENPVFTHLNKDNFDVKGSAQDKIIFLMRRHNESSIYAVFNFNTEKVNLDSVSLDGKWKKILDSSDKTWLGQGSVLPEIINPKVNQRIDSRIKLCLNSLSCAVYEKIPS